MLRRFLLLPLILWLMDRAAAQIAEVLPAGTLLQCTLDEPNFSSRTAQSGDPILCHLGALAAFGHSVFPLGCYLAGHFQEYRDPGRFFSKGWIELGYDRLVLPGAQVLPLSAKVISVPHPRVDRDGKIHGRGHPKRGAIGWVTHVLLPNEGGLLGRGLASALGSFLIRKGRWCILRTSLLLRVVLG